MEVKKTMKIYKNSAKLLQISLFLIGISLIFSFGINTTDAANTSNIYVNTHGNDNWDGLNSTHTSGLNGPKATIKNATGTVKSSGTVHIASGTYNENNIQINSNMNIMGESQKNTIIDGQQSGNSIFTIASGINITITNLTLINGKSGNGGAIDNSGNLTVNNCIFINNSASGDAGGAIFSDGDINVNNCTFENNSAESNGGSIATTGNSTINNSKFTENQAGYGGGAIYNEGKSTISNSTFINNPGYYYGNVWNLGSMTINNSLFKDTETFFGGGVSSFDNITVKNCEFINNTGIISGGGIFIQGTAYILGSNFSNNNNANQGRGGAIFNNAGTVSVNFCRIVGNELYQIAGTTTDATLNWWGSNSDPTSNVENGITVGPWLVLNITTNETTINIGGKSTVTANLLHDSNGVYHDPQNGHVPDGLTVNFSSDSNGTLTPISAVTKDGQANTTFTGTNIGISEISATIDNQKVLTNITINKTTTTLHVNPVSGLKGKDVNLIAKLTEKTGNVPVKGAQIQFSINGTVVGTAKTNNNGIATLKYYITQNSGTYPIFAEYLGNSTYIGINNTNQLTINPTPVNPVYDLYLQITSSNNHPKVGELFTITYKLGNYGPDNASNVTVTIPLPLGFIIMNIHGDGNWIYNTANRTLTWKLTNVAVGDPYLYITGKTAQAGLYVFGSSISSETLKLNSETINPILINTTNSNQTNHSTVNTDTNTIPMQNTGVPIAGLLLGILSLIGGSVLSRRK